MAKTPMVKCRKDVLTSTPTPLHQGRRRHQSQKGKDSQLDSKIDSLEEKIRLIQGLNSFGNTDFSSMSWFPNMTVPPKFKAPGVRKIQWEGKNRGCGAVKTKRMVDMPALMALVEQIAKRTLVEKNEGGVQDDSQERQEMVEDSSMLYSLGISQGVSCLREVNRGTRGSYIKIDDGS
uniref:Uncharacterized protein n=1 Tax=Fagus sylvatica TaxID=28930 RepID=A0A2N9FV38_FAGSY